MPSPIIKGNCVKPLRLGPVIISARKTPTTLHIPLVAQGEWVDTPDGEELLTVTAGKLADKVEEWLIEQGDYVPEDERQFDSPVSIDADDNENVLVLRITCKDSTQAKKISEFITSQIPYFHNIELMSPSITPSTSNGQLRQ